MTNPREEAHGKFVSGLKGWRMLKYSDGGPALRRSDRRKRKTAKLARRRNRS